MYEDDTDKEAVKEVSKFFESVRKAKRRKKKARILKEARRHNHRNGGARRETET